MLRAMSYYGQTREIFYPGEEVLARYGTAYLRAMVIEVMGEGSYKVKLLDIDYDNLVYVNTDRNQIKKYDTKRQSLDYNNDMKWPLGNSLQDNFYERNRDRPQYQSPIRNSWKTYSSPRKMNLHNMNYNRYQSPKRSLLHDNKDKKTASSPMTELIENLKTLIASPVMGSYQKQPMANFSRTPGSRRMLPAMNGNSNSFFSGNQNFGVSPENEHLSLGHARNNVNFPRHTTRPYQDVQNNYLLHHQDMVLSSQFKERPKPSPNQPYLTWTGKLPLKDFNDNKYSRKVFLGGVPWDITNEDLENTFSPFGDLSVEWPPVKNGQKPKGYVYIVFDESSSVNKLLEFCRKYSERVFRDVSDGTMYKFHVQSEKMKSKEIQVIPWNLNDSTKVIGPQDKVNMHHQVFVGGLHGMLTATGLSQVMNDLFGNIVYVEIDTDKYKYPLGSGRVNFSSLESYQQAILGKYVQVNCSVPKIDKRIQIDPYIRENENCSKCLDYPGPLYCRTCLDYFCEGCWDWHMRHSSVKHEWVSRTRNGKVI